MNDSHSPLRRRLAVTVFNFLLLALLPAALASAQQTPQPPRVRMPESADLGGWSAEITARYYATEKVLPVYPDEAVTKGVQGVVMVRIGVDKEGKVGRVKVPPRTHPLLRRAAVVAARQWRFEPMPHSTMKPGQYHTYRLTFQFVIEDGKARAGLHPNWRYGPDDGGYLTVATEWTKWEDATDDYKDKD
jgi:TonB family protein